MSGCLDSVNCNCDCDSLEPVKEWLKPKRNMFASVIAGTLVRTHFLWLHAHFTACIILVCSFLWAGGQSLMPVLIILSLSMEHFIFVGLSPQLHC